MRRGRPILTARQRQAFNLLAIPLVRGDAPPTYREMARAMGLSIPTAFQHVEALVAKGTRRGNANRIRVGGSWPESFNQRDRRIGRRSVDRDDAHK